MEMTVKEAAEQLGIPEHTVRYYTDMGMIPDLKRTSSNYRLFDEEAMEWLRGTVYFRQLGLSLKDIRHYHDLCFQDDPDALWERYELLSEYCEKAHQEVGQAQKRLEYLLHIADRDRQIAEKAMPDLKNPYLRRKP